MAGRSIVEWLGPQNKDKCGYCKSRDRSSSHGQSCLAARVILTAYYTYNTECACHADYEYNPSPNPSHKFE